MPKAKRRSYSEEAERLQQRSLEVQTKGQIEWVMKSLKERRDLVASVVQHLEKCGVKRPAKFQYKAEQKEDASTQPAKKLKEEPSERGSAGLSDGRTENGEGAAEEEGDEDGGKSKEVLPFVPRKYSTWQDVPPHYLEELLACLEKVSCAKAALKGLVPKGKKIVKAEPLLQIFELITGWDRAADIHPGDRNVELLKQKLTKVNMERGRLARDLEIPLNWVKSGIYTLTPVPGGCGLLVHSLVKAGKKEFPVQNPKLTLDQFRVEFNFCDNRAIIVHPCSPSQTLCALLWAPTLSSSFCSPVKFDKDKGVLEEVADIKEETVEVPAAAAASGAPPPFDESLLRIPPPPAMFSGTDEAPPKVVVPPDDVKTEPGPGVEK
jgi:hypothetical protein